MGKKLTQEEAEKLVETKSKGKFKLISKYIRSDKEAEFECTDCGTIKKTKNFFFTSLNLCKGCRNYSNVLTQDEIKERIKILSGGKFKPKNVTRIKEGGVVECIICGYTKEIKNFTSDSYACKGCNRIELTNKKKEEIRKKGYILLDEAIETNATQKYLKNKVMRIECGHVFEAVVDNIIFERINCPRCRALTTEEVRKRIFEETNGEFIMTSEYMGVNTVDRMTLVHIGGCGKSFKVTHYGWYGTNDTKIKNGFYCRVCSPVNINYSHEQFIEIIKSITKTEFDILGEYKDSKSKIKVRHKCGHVFEIHASVLLSQKSKEYKIYGTTTCSECSSNNSLGQKKISSYLKEIGVPYEKEKRFEGCRHKKKLPFDFALYKNGKLVALLEFDGKQHSEIVEHMGGKKGFKERRRNDKIKNKYAKDIGVRMIRIPHFQADRIEEILDRWIKRLYGDNNNNSVAA